MTSSQPHGTGSVDGTGSPDGVVVLDGVGTGAAARVRAAQATPGLRCLVLDLVADDAPDTTPDDELVVTVATGSVPVVALLRGAIGPSRAAVALAADLRLCSDDATIRLDGLRGGTSATLPHVVGAGAASLLLLAPEPVEAPRALSLGLVHASRPAHELGRAGVELARRVAQQPAGTGAALRRAMPSVDVTAAIAEEQRLREIVRRHES